MNKGILFVLIILIIESFISCSTEDSFLESDRTEEQDDDNYAQEKLLHNKWTYSRMRSEYFWYKEMPDSASLSFYSEPDDFFRSLLFSQDRFSWCENNVNYKEGFAGNISGFEYQRFEVYGSILNRILYVYSKDLMEAGLARGDYFQLEENYIIKGTIQNRIFKPLSKIKIIQTMTKSSDLAPTISLDTIYTIGNKKIGYFIYDQFKSTTDVAQIAIRLKNRCITDLIVDLRYNPGGYVSTSKNLASMLVPNEYLGKLYQLQRYNDIQTRIKREKGGSGIDSVFLDNGFVTFERNLNLDRVVVLTTKNTASASEALIIGLRPYMDVITIGTTSCGKDVGSYTIADNRYKYQLQPITFRYYNALNDSTPGTGIVPDIQVEDDLNHKRGDTNEALLHAAINYLLGKKADVSTRSIGDHGEREYGKSSIQIKNNL